MMPRAQRTRRGQRRQRFGAVCARVFASVSLVASASLVPAATVHAQMATAPSAAGYKREPGAVSSSMPAALQGIGFDQNIDQHVPLEHVAKAQHELDEGWLFLVVGDEGEHGGQSAGSKVQSRRGFMADRNVCPTGLLPP